MKRILILATLVSFVGAGFAVAQQQPSNANWATAKKIYLGWVDINLDDWSVLGYGNADEWAEVVKTNNITFQRLVQQRLPGRQVVGAKSKAEEDPSGHELQVRFSDVRFDSESYALSLSIHFLDPQAASELVSIPVRSYRGGHFSVDRCMKGAMEKVAEKLGDEIQRRARGK